MVASSLVGVIVGTGGLVGVIVGIGGLEVA